MMVKCSQSAYIPSDLKCSGAGAHTHTHTHMRLHACGNIIARLPSRINTPPLINYYDEKEETIARQAGRSARLPVIQYRYQGQSPSDSTAVQRRRRRQSNRSLCKQLWLSSYSSWLAPQLQPLSCHWERPTSSSWSFLDRNKIIIVSNYTDNKTRVPSSFTIFRLLHFVYLTQILTAL